VLGVDSQGGRRGDSGNPAGYGVHGPYADTVPSSPQTHSGSRPGWPAGVPAVAIPPDLLPHDGRFGCGPSKVRPDAVEALARAGSSYLGTSHRQEGVRSVVRHIRQGMGLLFSLPEGYEVLLGNGGTTAFWDAATFGLIEQHSEHLSFGEFSAKFAAVTAGAPHLDDPVIVESPPGTVPEWKASDADAFATAHNETS